jgi:hypothetical protein
LANRNKDRRARSRKRRPAGAAPAPQSAAQGPTAETVEPADGASAPAKASARRAADGSSSKTSRAAERSSSKTSRAAAPPSPKARRKPHSSPAAPTFGERPQSPWHPLPLSELLILVGAIFVILGLRKLDAHHPEISKGGATLLAGLGAVAIGSFEVALREHRSGYRSHTVMLALLVVLMFHSLVVLGVSVFTTAPRLLNVGLFAVDIALFAFLFRQLRVRFLDARHARVLKEG